MGYTHYWSYNQRLDDIALEAAIRDARKIVQEVEKRGIVLCDGLGNGKPKVTAKSIVLNGDGSQGLDHETFIFPMSPEAAKRAIELHGYAWDFTKTARKPYDLAVCSILLVLKHHLGNQFRVNSDGGRTTEEWLPAEELVKNVLGYHVEYVSEETLLEEH